MAKINARRTRERKRIAFGDKAEWIRTLPCTLAYRRPADCRYALDKAGRFYADPAHVVHSQGAGGTSEDLAPLCRKHHREQHAAGIRTFERRYNIDLTTMATKLHKLWMQIEERAA